MANKRIKLHGPRTVTPLENEDAVVREVIRRSRERRPEQLRDEDLRGIKRSESFNVIIDVTERRFRLLKIFFAKNGGIHVAFPSFHDSRGLLSEVAHGTGTKVADVSLTEEGFVTTHLVKYSHYPDGEAHFSQDGKIFTKVRRKAAGLKEIDGHLFTAYCRGLLAFEEHPAPPSNKANKTIEITYLRGSEPDAAVKLTGYLFSFDEAKRRCIKESGKGGIGIINDDNEVRWGIMMSEPPGRTLSEHLLLLTYEDARLSGSTDPYLFFLGGFDPTPIVEDARQSTRFLTLMYPGADFERLRDELESIDFPGSAT